MPCIFWSFFYLTFAYLYLFPSFPFRIFLQLADRRQKRRMTLCMITADMKLDFWHLPKCMNIRCSRFEQPNYFDVYVSYSDAWMNLKLHHLIIIKASKIFNMIYKTGAWPSACLRERDEDWRVCCSAGTARARRHEGESSSSFTRFLTQTIYINCDKLCHYHYTNQCQICCNSRRKF